jgi:hypothetical protein
LAGTDKLTQYSSPAQFLRSWTANATIGAVTVYDYYVSAEVNTEGGKGFSFLKVNYFAIEETRTEVSGSTRCGDCILLRDVLINSIGAVIFSCKPGKNSLTISFQHMALDVLFFDDLDSNAEWNWVLSPDQIINWASPQEGVGVFPGTEVVWVGSPRGEPEASKWRQ